ncbi:MAG: GNAT family N-acetyltransferase [Anaerolineae bacterium]|nr:GNAT family N-acetyltransferase [Anaerolineae bacterium]
MSEKNIQLTEDAVVSLREVTKDNLGEILRLRVKPGQEKFVATNATSIAEAHYEEKAWFRAIYADDTPVGFLMLYDDPETTDYFLWRLMIDGRYQGLGFGERAAKLLIDYVRALPGATELMVSYVPEEGNPEPFYTRLGFVHTGEIHDGEKVMKLFFESADSNEETGS